MQTDQPGPLSTAPATPGQKPDLNVVLPEIISAQLATVSSFDIYRGVVCISIVAFHCYLGHLGKWLGPSAGWAMSNLRFGYEAFFVLGGYFIARSFRSEAGIVVSARDFLARRMVRLALPYWAAIVLGVASFEASSAVRGEPNVVGNVADLWPLLLFVQDLIPTNAVSMSFWFMAPYVQFLAIWCAFVSLVRALQSNPDSNRSRERRSQVLTAAIGLAMFASLACIASGEPWRWKLANNVAYLVIGCLAYWYTSGQPVRIWLACGLVCLVAIGAWYELHRPILAAISAVLLIVLTRVPRLRSNRISRAMSFVGVRSYSIYLTHTFVALRVLNWRWPVGGDHSAAVASILWFAAILASVAVGVAFYHFVERPASRLAGRFKYLSPVRSE